MMKYLFILIFLIPLLNFWWFYMLCLMLMFFMFVFLNDFLSGMYVVNGYMYIDLVSYGLMSLTLWVGFLMILASYVVYKKMYYCSEFLMSVMFILIFLLISFSIDNLIMFYMSFESSIIPTLFLIFGWGYQPERLLAGFYLLFYTLFASLPMLMGCLYIYNLYGSLVFSILSFKVNFYLYLSLVLVFLVKLPMLFFHFWLPKAHVEAPVSGSMVLAAILLKLGGYGLYRVFKIMSNCMNYNFLWLILSLFCIYMVSLLCLCQVDMKSLIAYSSINHMGLVICGIMTCNLYGFMGSYLLMIGHGLCSSGLFCFANILYERTFSRSFYINKGLIAVMPSMCLFMFLFSVNNMASPPSLNFWGEVMIINSVISWNASTFIFLMLSSFFSCCYSIYLFSTVQHGLLSSGLFSVMEGNVREFLLLFFHLFPLNFMFLMADFFMFV